MDSRQGAVQADLQGNEMVGCAVKGIQLVAAKDSFEIMNLLSSISVVKIFGR